MELLAKVPFLPGLNHGHSLNKQGEGLLTVFHVDRILKAGWIHYPSWWKLCFTHLFTHVCNTIYCTLKTYQELFFALGVQLWTSQSPFIHGFFYSNNQKQSSQEQMSLSEVKSFGPSSYRFLSTDFSETSNLFNWRLQHCTFSLSFLVFCFVFFCKQDTPAGIIHFLFECLTYHHHLIAFWTTKAPYLF